MAKIERKTQKIFAGKAENDELAVFGSMTTGNPNYTDNIEDLQSEAYENGWSDAIAANEAPFLEEMNGVQYGFSKQLAYIFQEGIPEYDEGTTYYKGSIVKGFNEENVLNFYRSLKDDNRGISLTDVTAWENINDFTNQSKALETGSVSSVPEVYEDIYKYAHSTFDLDKFTIQGSPTISDDGVVFTPDKQWVLDTNYVIDVEKSWEIGFEFDVTPEMIATDMTSSWFLSNAIGDGSQMQVQHYMDGKLLKIRVWVNNTDKTTVDTLDFGTSSNGFKLEEGQHIKFNIGYDKRNTKYYWNTYINGLLTYNNSVISPYKLITPTTKASIVFGNFSTGYKANVFKGKADLKTFYIKEDDTIVFSGNKTGVDIIKPDNYTPVGDATVSPEGIASGFEREKPNYVTLDTKLDFTKPFQLDMKVNTGTILKSNDTCYFFSSISDIGNMVIGLTNEFRYILFLSHTGTGWDLTDAVYGKTHYNPVLNTDYYIRLMWDGNKYVLQASEDDVNYITEITVKSSLPLFSDVYQKVGNNQLNGRAFVGGTIDLNSIKFYSEGRLVYQPCLRIPYTLSKTGSKIVDARYRDRVQDMYEQFGYAPYYTIDEENKNFTLPMGEIYGIIEKTLEKSKSYDDILRQIGDPIPTFSNTLNDDEIWLEGDKVLKTTYPKLTEIYGDTYAPTEAEDTDTYLYLPDCKDRTAWGSPDGSYGYIEAGLPDITGSMSNIDGGGGTITASGAFSVTGQWAAHGRGQENSNHSNVNFTASRSSKIYGGSTTVQTPSFKVRWKTRFR